MNELRFFPQQASTVAAQIDALYGFLVGMSGFFTGLIFLLLLVFMIKYRRRSDEEPARRQIRANPWLEVIWIVIPLGLTMVVFVWGARLYAMVMNPPADALEIYAIGKQWMWKFQHPEGRSEINELHVPVGRAVKMTMSTQDVIHSFYVPAFRIKMDVVPGRYTHTWFEATTPGEYYLFCAEYCGTAHSGMQGRVIVMPQMEYQQWLRQGQESDPMRSAGARLFHQLGCVTCHRGETPAGPSLAGLFGSTVRLQSGATISADENYVRESILRPNARIVAGYRPLMPSFEGQLSEEELLYLVSYIKTLHSNQEGGN